MALLLIYMVFSLTQNDECRLFFLMIDKESSNSLEFGVRGDGQEATYHVQFRIEHLIVRL